MRYVIGHVWDERITDWCNLTTDGHIWIDVSRARDAKRYTADEALHGVALLEVGVLTDLLQIIPEDLLCITG